VSFISSNPCTRTRCGRCEIAGLTSHTVRDVAPRNLMMCLSFPLPPAAAFASSPGSEHPDLAGPGSLPAADGSDPRPSEEATRPSEEGTAPDEGGQREAKRAKA